jgi:uncharacterized Zn finger protein (UPF0148 family)
MADLLKSGHRMLNLSCPICKNPIFQKKDGSAFCPICNRKVLLVENEEKLKNEVESKEIKNIRSILIPIFIKKLLWISQKLEDETQLSVLSEYLEITLKILNLVDKINNLN